MCDKEYGFTPSKKTKVNNRIKILRQWIYIPKSIYICLYAILHTFSKNVPFSIYLYPLWAWYYFFNHRIHPFPYRLRMYKQSLLYSGSLLREQVRPPEKSGPVQSWGLGLSGFFTHENRGCPCAGMPCTRFRVVQVLTFSYQYFSSYKKYLRWQSIQWINWCLLQHHQHTRSPNYCLPPHGHQTAKYLATLKRCWKLTNISSRKMLHAILHSMGYDYMLC